MHRSSTTANLRRNPSSPQVPRRSARQQAQGLGSPLASQRNRGAYPSNESAPPNEATETSAATLHEVTLHEVCSICLEPLADSVCFAFPCGFNHRLHYPCALLFLSSSLSTLEAVADSSPARRVVTEGLGQGLRAISAIGAALKRTPLDAIKRICCPLCRRSWPADDDVPVDSIMGQLGELRILIFRDAAEKMVQAILQASNHFEHGSDARQARMTKGFIALDRKLHSAASWLASQSHNEYLMACILSLLQCKWVKSLSAVSRACGRICYDANKLRAPHVSVGKVRTAMHHISAPDLRALEAIASRGDACMTAFDVLTCTKWLSTCNGIRELVLSGMKWQQIDPGGQHLGTSLADKPLRILDLSNNSLMDDSLKCLAEALIPKMSKSRTLQVLNVSINCSTQVGLVALLPLGSRAGGVQDWGFRHNQLGDTGCHAIAKALHTEHIGCHVNATAWDLRTNRISAEGIKSLLCVIPSMSVARLGCNPLGDVGAKWLAQGIGETLVTLDLGQAKIGDEGASALAKKLMNGSLLRDLLLAGNEIGAVGASCLADGWAWVTNLRLVDLSYNPLGTGGVQCIAQELPFWTQSPFRLCLGGVDCDDEGAQYLVRALDKNSRRSWKWTIDFGNNKCRGMHVHEMRRLLEETDEKPVPAKATPGEADGYNDGQGSEPCRDVTASKSPCGYIEPQLIDPHVIR